ncbi:MULTISPECIES: acyl-CoA dehydrogenase family protein [unclassified Streptomyces]|uniref:acyl-CoA dehydrogenase family protein n=1 Tax=unclassified Streptomyces TaxID=2593676 RepID=UPI0007492CA9|nr:MULTISPECIES: acyl-CoA dehydrogenase family protein [unclassified Streptomyces]KUL77605.1 acyl-CoA dehydrogenase [Streptomyces sp. NRRL WC-3605]KUL78762.1 acyl-CoA dehydrogenase [Streptomyces sp. NRRL WC-3604]
MDFTFSEEQQAAAEAARGVFAGVTPDAVPSPALVPGAVADGFDRTLWDRLAEADLLSLLLAEEYGGAGLDPIALCLVLRESAKVLARVPLLESCAATAAVQAFGTGELKDRVLRRAGRGDLVLTVAAHGRTGHGPAELAVTARPDGRDWLLDGTQTAIAWAHDADLVVVPARTPADRTVLAVVPRETAGLTLAEQFSTSGERLGELRLDAVRITARDVMDTPDAWEWLRQLLATGTCALALGLGEQVLRMTSAYTAGREQFGHPVATFQAVAVQCADRYIDLCAMEATLWQGAWRIGSGAPGALPAAGDVAVAKIWASDGVRRVVQTAQHLHGGFGADVDYPLHRYHAWAKHLELSLGPAAAHEETLGDLLAAHPLG